MDYLIDIESSVQFKPAEVQFPQYEEIRSQAVALASRIREVEVTEDNIKEVKKDLAQVRKLVTELNNRRKLVKAKILEDYNAFETQIKDIDSIISDAENEIRSQTRMLEEAERDRKRETIKELWDMRVSQYTVSHYGDFFDKWLQPGHLNKSTSMKSVESDMVEWLEARQKDIDTLSSMDGEYFVEYIDTLDLAQSIANVNRKREIRGMTVTDEDTEDKAEFVIIGKKNITLTEALLKENEIEYRRIK